MTDCPVYVEAPAPAPSSTLPAVFLAGGITGCPDWQSELVALLAARPPAPLMLLNPRRASFRADDLGAAAAQVAWEHRMLRRADAISFWFPCETLCPIVLYELGAWSMEDKPMFVGAHPDYLRRQDVILQTALARPDVEVVGSLGALADQLRSLATPSPPRPDA